MRLIKCAGYLAPMPISVPTQNLEHSFTGHRINPESIDVSTVMKWLDFCQCYHRSSCGIRQQKTLSGLKVIDCKSRKVIPAPLCCRYVALSYVWGPPAKEMQHSAAIDTSELRVESLPNVVLDAIGITDKLGFEYLWVDRYCINQHSSEEKHSQIRNMDSIYNTAELTLIAAVGDNPSFGLPGASSQRPRIPQTEISLGGIKYVSIPPDPKRLVELSTWAQRAWTYQEGLLSTRRLIFTEYQTYFECQQMHCLEAIDSPVKILHNKKQLKLLKWNDSGLFPRTVSQVCSDVWGRIVEYTERHLTYEEDILNGMLGILKSFERLRAPVRHHFGVPLAPVIRRSSTTNKIVKLHSTTLEQFVLGLCWKLYRPSKRRAKLESFPGWSWIGWLGRVYPDLNSSAMRDTFRIKIAIEMMDGTSIPVEKFFSLAYNKVSPSALSPLLQIEAETIGLSIQCLTSEFEVLRLKPGWWAKIVLTQDHVLYAKLNWTIRIEDYEDVAKRMSEPGWRGIILGEKRKVYYSGDYNNSSHLILLVDDAVPIKERIGCIDFEDFEGLVEWVSESLHKSYVLDTERWKDGFLNGKVRRVRYWELKEEGVKIPTERRSFRLR